MEERRGEHMKEGLQGGKKGEMGEWSTGGMKRGFRGGVMHVQLGGWMNGRGIN